MNKQRSWDGLGDGGVWCFYEPKKSGQTTFDKSLCWVILAVLYNLFFLWISVPFRASELAPPQKSECLGMSTFFRGITETIPSLFRGIFSERNSVPNPIRGSVNPWIYIYESMIPYLQTGVLIKGVKGPKDRSSDTSSIFLLYRPMQSVYSNF